MKNVLRGLTILTMILCMSWTVNAQKFGYLNSAALLAELPEVKQADANLESLQKQLQKKGQQMLEELQRKYQSVDARQKSGELSPKQVESEAAKLKDEEGKLARYEQDMVKQIQSKREELLKPIIDKVNAAIASVAKDNGYNYILDSSGGMLLYATDDDDVTSLVKTKLGI